MAGKSKEDVKGGPQLEDKGKDKEVQPLTKANHSEDALTIRDMVSKAKDAESESKSKARDTKSKGSWSQGGLFCFISLYYPFFFNDCWPLIMMYLPLD